MCVRNGSVCPVVCKSLGFEGFRVKIRVWWQHQETDGREERICSSSLRNLSQVAGAQVRLRVCIFTSTQVTDTQVVLEPCLGNAKLGCPQNLPGCFEAPPHCHVKPSRSAAGALRPGQAGGGSGHTACSPCSIFCRWAPVPGGAAGPPHQRLPVPPPVSSGPACAHSSTLSCPVDPLSCPALRRLPASRRPALFSGARLSVGLLCDTCCHLSQGDHNRGFPLG